MTPRRDDAETHTEEASCLACGDCCTAAATRTIARQIAELRRLRKALRNAKGQVTPLVDWEMGEGTRGEVSDPLRGVLRILDAALKPARRKP